MSEASSASARDERRSPFQGLVPYGEADAEWFFGRREWTEIIVDNLRAYRISILYGASGVGKSSVLNAGVIRGLRTLAASNLAATGTPQLVVVPFAAWSSDEPVAALQEAVREAVEMTAPALAHRPPTGRLADVCVEWGNRIGGPLLVVLDQFEEYFLYHRGDGGPGSLHEELSVALRRRSTPANFVLSIREDALAQLDRFEGRVPGLLANLLRIDHLDRAAAREAIERPLEHWNRVVARPGEEAEIEPALVEAVLDQVETGKLRVDEAGIGAAPADGGGELRVEAPYLQLVLSRLWAEERSLGSRVLRLQSLERLGGAERIVRTHLDATMGGLPRIEQDVAARAFRYLVTPSGTKIAQRVDDLAELSDVPRERLEPVLEELSGEVRILRPTADGAYEVYHDALVGPILHWRAVWQERQRRRRERRRLALSASGAVVLALVAAAFLALFVAAREARDDARSRELAARAGAVLGSDPQESLRLAVSAVVERTDGASGERSAGCPGRGERGCRAARSPRARHGRGVQPRRHARRHLERRWNGGGVGRAQRPQTPRAARPRRPGSERRVQPRRPAHPHRRRRRHGAALGRRHRPRRPRPLAATTAGSSPPPSAPTARASSPQASTGRRASGTPAAAGPSTCCARAAPSAPPSSAPTVRASSRPATTGRHSSGTPAAARCSTPCPVTPAPSGAPPSARTAEQIATAGSDGTARVWDGRSGELVALRGHAAPSARFSPNGPRPTPDDARPSTPRPSLLSFAATRAPSRRRRSARTAGASSLRATTARHDCGTPAPAGTCASCASTRMPSGAPCSARTGGSSRRRATTGRGGSGTSPSGREPPRSSRSRRTGLERDLQRRRRARGDGGRRRDRTHLGRPRRRQPPRTPRLRRPCLASAFSPDGRLLATGNEAGTAYVWDSRTGRALRTLRGHGGAVYSVAFSSDATRIVTTSDDGTARIWDAGTGRVLRTLRGQGGVYGAAFSSDAARIVTASDDGTAQHLGQPHG